MVNILPTNEKNDIEDSNNYDYESINVFNRDIFMYTIDIILPTVYR